MSIYDYSISWNKTKNLTWFSLLKNSKFFVVLCSNDVLLSWQHNATQHNENRCVFSSLIWIKHCMNICLVITLATEWSTVLRHSPSNWHFSCLGGGQNTPFWHPPSRGMFRSSDDKCNKWNYPQCLGRGHVPLIRF